MDMDILEPTSGSIVNPQTLAEMGNELDHSELPDSSLRIEFLQAHGLEEGSNTSSVSTSAGKQVPEWVNWYTLEGVLQKSYHDIEDERQSSGPVESSQQKDQPGVKGEEEQDELEPELETNNEARGVPVEKRLLHTRHLTTNFPLTMKSLKGGTWKNVDFHEGPHRDRATDTLDELVKRAERVPLQLKGPFKLVPGRTIKNYLKHPVTSPLGTIQTKGGEDVFLLHPQLSDEAEMEDLTAYGLIMHDKMMRDVDRPQFRETWFNSLALLLDSPGCPFEVDVHIKATLYTHDGPKRRVGQNARWTLAFDTELKIYGKIDSLITRTKLTPALFEHLRRVLHVFLPSSDANTPKDDIKLQEFYEVLKPAPTPPADVLQLVQPQGMVAKLKPFQQRAVAWLLRNEDATSIHPYFERKSVVDPEGLWELVQFGSEDGKGLVDLAFCRMTGRLQPVSKAMLDRKTRLEKGKGKETGESSDSRWLLPEEGLLRLCDVRGSLLAEEMGLGKTLEAIATVLLHPRMNKPEVEVVKMEESDAEMKEADDGASELSNTEDRPKKRRRIAVDTGIDVEADTFEGAFKGSSRWDQELKLHVHEIKSTLVVTPKILLRQWVEETKRHAPHLQYVVYEGYSDMMEDWLERGPAVSGPGKRKRETQTEQEEMARIKPRTGENVTSFFQRWYNNWIQRMATTDVVFVTYDTLGKDLDVALAPVERPRRAVAGPPREKPRSVLSMCQFWRIIMDEVQMLDARSASKAAQMVTSLQRVNSLVLSGTPAKQAVQDLQSALHFVGVNIHPWVWNRFLKPGFRHAFRDLFGEVAIRHTKKMVKNETDIPPQTRTLVPIKMNIVELQYYRDTLYRNIDALAVSKNGYRDTESLRSLVQTLRAVCTHIQTNELENGVRVERTRMGRENGAVLKDMDQALNTMQVQAWRDYHHHIYVLQSTRIKYALALHSDQPDQYRRSIDLLRRADKESQKEVEAIKKTINGMTDVVDLESDEGDDHLDVDVDAESNGTGPESSVGKARAVLRARVRDFMHLSHEALFRCGDLYHQHPEQEGYGELETESYASADAVRQLMLARPLAKSNSSIDRVRSVIKGSRITRFSVLEVEEGGPLGIETAKYGTAINNFIEEAMNRNAECVWNLRGQVVERLLEKVDFKTDDIDATGNEFEASLQAQAMLEVYMAAYTDALADRREMLTEGTTFIREVERKKGKKRETQTAKAVAVDIPEDEEDAEYHKEIKAKRQEYREAYAGFQSLQGLISELDDFVSGHDRRNEERELAKMEKQRLRGIKEDQLALLKKLEDEAKSLNHCFNVRLIFFKTLQQISDTLIDPETAAEEKEAVIRLTEPNTAERMKNTRLRERAMLLETVPITFATMERQIATAQAHARYLDSLNEKNKDQDEDEECMICQQEFSEIKGVVMVLYCAHRMCHSCYNEYMRSAARATCPCCRLAIVPSQVHKVDPRKTDPPAKPKPTKAETLAMESDIIPDALDLEALNVLPRPRQGAVAEVEIHGQWGAKLDFMIKHLKYWKRTEPDVKHIVFSAWASSLEIVQTALTANQIKWTTIGHKKAQKTAVKDFATNDCQVFLLHGERQVSGLTLTAAAVVHLLEPVMNQGYELQAIGRVDRLGQAQETHVFCYACEETIEAKIINRGLRAGHCIYAKGVDQNTFDAQATTVSGKKGTDKNSGDHDDLMDLLL